MICKALAEEFIPREDDHPMVVAALHLLAERPDNRVLILAGIIERGGHLVCSCSLGAFCTKPGKHPLSLTPNGVWDATRSPKKIRRWYREHPDGNLGWAADPGLIIVDEDGERGRQSLSARELPTTRIQLSGRPDGGRHLPYLASRPCGCGDGPEGVDLRGVGGYIVLPPSRHWSGAIYQSDGAPLGMAPAWVEEMAGTPKPGYARRHALADLEVPRAVRWELYDEHDEEQDTDRRQNDRGRYRDRSEVVWRIIWSLLNAGWNDGQIIDLIRYGSSLHHRYPNRLEQRLGYEIERVRERMSSCPPRCVTSAAHIAVSDLHPEGSASCRRVLRALQQKCAEQGEGRFSASRDDLALMASCSSGSVTSAINYLIKRRWIVRLEDGVATRAALYMLNLPRGIRLEELDQHPMCAFADPYPPTLKDERVVAVSKYTTRVGTRDISPTGDAMRTGKDTVGKSFALIRELGSVHTVADLATRLSWPPERIRRHLRDLERAGVATRTGRTWNLVSNVIDVLDQIGKASSKAGAGKRQADDIARKRIRRLADQTRHSRGQGHQIEHQWEAFDLYDAYTGTYLDTLNVVTGLPDEGIVGPLILNLAKARKIDAHGFTHGLLDRNYVDHEPREVVRQAARKVAPRVSQPEHDVAICRRG